jgi:hypothetical protein
MPDLGPEDGLRLAAESEPPGDFVSEDLRADCHRFLRELRALIALRQQQSRDGAPPELHSGD